LQVTTLPCSPQYNFNSLSLTKYSSYAVIDKMVFVETKHSGDDKSISWINLECMVPETRKLFEIKTYIKRNIKAEKT